MKQQIKQYKNAISHKLCDEAIAKYLAWKKVKSDPQPDYSTRTYLELAKHKPWSALNNKFYQAMEKATYDYFEPLPGFEEVAQPEWSDEGLIMAHYRPNDFCALHVDGTSITPPDNHFRLATLVFFLNDVKKGGELDFPLQKLKIKPVKGSCVIFPPTMHFPHRVNTTQEDRFVVQSWIVDPMLKVVLAK